MHKNTAINDGGERTRNMPQNVSYFSHFSTLETKVLLMHLFLYLSASTKEPYCVNVGREGEGTKTRVSTYEGAKGGAGREQTSDWSREAASLLSL